jgi:hypothetical protein
MNLVFTVYKSQGLTLSRAVLNVSLLRAFRLTTVAPIIEILENLEGSCPCTTDTHHLYFDYARQGHVEDLACIHSEERKGPAYRVQKLLGI